MFNKKVIIGIMVAILATIVVVLVLSLHVDAQKDTSDDVGVRDVYTSPPLGEANELRKIKAVIMNFGTLDQNNPFNVSYKVQNITTLEVTDLGNKTVSSLASGQKITLEWGWTPEYIGDYKITVETGLSNDENPDNDQKSIIAWVRYVYLLEDFESDVSNWETGTEDTNENMVDEAIDEWEHGTPIEELVNGGKGPDSALSGTKCYGIDLDDKYGEVNKEFWEGYYNDSAYLSKEIDLTTAGDAKLLFHHWLEIEDSGDDGNIHDKAYVEASIDKGKTWEELWRNPVAPNPEYETVYKTDGWEQVILDLDDYSGKRSVLIRWRLQTNHNISYAGWYIDDIGVCGRAPLKNDAGIDSIDSPKLGEKLPLGRTALIRATVMNYGLNDLINCPVKLDIFETLSGDPVMDTKVVYVGTVSHPMGTGETIKVEFEWQVSDKFESMDYDIHVYTYLTDPSDKYIDGYLINDEKVIKVRGQDVLDVAVEDIEIDIKSKIAERGKPINVRGTIANRGNIAVKFDLTLKAKWRQDYTDWDDIDPIEPPIFDEQIQVDAGEVLDNWNITYVPEVYAEYQLTLRTSNVLISYDYKSGLPVDDPKAWTLQYPDCLPENSYMSLSFRIPKIIWQDDMENGGHAWTHNPVKPGGYDDWHIEYGGYHGSNWSWRCGQGMWIDPYLQRLYHNRMNAYLSSSPIELVTENVQSGFGISFWMKYVIEPMNDEGKYLDSIFLEYLPDGGNPDVNDDWEAIYVNNYDHSPYHPMYWDARLFWPKDGGMDTTDSNDYPNNIDGWIYNQIIFDEIDPKTGENIYIKEDGVSEIDDWLWDGFQFRFRFMTDDSIQYTGPWIDNVAVFGYLETSEPPIAKFESNWTDMSDTKYTAYSWNIIDSIPSLTALDNVLPPRDVGGVLFNDDDHNTVWFVSKSADPWDGTKGLSYKWDFNDQVDSNSDGNYVNDDDSGDERFTMLDDKGAWVTWKFEEFGKFTVNLWVTDKDEITTSDSLVVSCGDKPIYNVNIEVEEISETEDSAESIECLDFYGSGEDWAIWQGDTITLSAAGGIDPEKMSSDQFKYIWAVVKGSGEDTLWKDLKWETTTKRGDANKEFTYQEHFKKPGNYIIIVDVDDGSNYLRYETNVPENLGWEVLSSYSWSWLDWINITVLPFSIESTMNNPVYLSDLEGNVVEVYYEVAYQASTQTTLLDKITKGTVEVVQTNEPEDSETANNLKVFVDFTTKNMYDANGEKGFVWAHIIIIYPKQNLPEQLWDDESNPNRKYDVVLLYYWDENHNVWYECENTKKPTTANLIDLTAVEANITHFTIVAPLINSVPLPLNYKDLSIKSNEIEILNTPVEKQKLYINAIIHNNGNRVIDVVVVKFKEGENLIKEIMISEIPGFGSKNASIIWTPEKHGDYEITVELDPYNKIEEINEKNNIATIQINIDKDTDGDGIGDKNDAFLNDPSASVDNDGDGYPDEWNKGKSQNDSTNGLILDAFPNDPKEWLDTDGDGIGNNVDEDDDNDNFTDKEEIEAGTDPLDKNSYPSVKSKDKDGFKLNLLIILPIIVVIIGIIGFLYWKNIISKKQIPPEIYSEPQRGYTPTFQETPEKRQQYQMQQPQQWQQYQPMVQQVPPEDIQTQQMQVCPYCNAHISNELNICNVCGKQIKY